MSAIIAQSASNITSVRTPVAPVFVDDCIVREGKSWYLTQEGVAVMNAAISSLNAAPDKFTPNAALLVKFYIGDNKNNTRTLSLPTALAAFGIS
jgi:hypothetical protein